MEHTQNSSTGSCSFSIQSLLSDEVALPVDELNHLENASLSERNPFLHYPYFATTNTVQSQGLPWLRGINFAPLTMSSRPPIHSFRTEAINVLNESLINFSPALGSGRDEMPLARNSAISSQMSMHSDQENFPRKNVVRPIDSISPIRSKAPNRISTKRKERKHKRTTFSLLQLEKLEAVFKNNQYPTEGEREKLSKSFQLKPECIKVWFQNRRSRMKKTKVNNNGSNGSDSSKRASSFQRLQEIATSSDH